MKISEQTRNVSIPERLVTRIESRVPRTEFDSTSEYVTFVLEEVLQHVEAADGDDAAESIDQAEVEDRLTALGYLDE